LYGLRACAAPLRSGLFYRWAAVTASSILLLFIARLCAQRFNRIDGKLWADDLAEMAVDAFLGFGDLRRVIAFFIESRGGLQNFFRTERNAVPAPLAAVFNKVHYTSRYDHLFGIKGHSPEIHGLCSPMAYVQKQQDIDFS
jgi:hypothetical protein